jgi:hypothetical protein
VVQRLNQPRFPAVRTCRPTANPRRVASPRRTPVCTVPPADSCLDSERQEPSTLSRKTCECWSSPAQPTLKPHRQVRAPPREWGCSAMKRCCSWASTVFSRVRLISVTAQTLLKSRRMVCPVPRLGCVPSAPAPLAYHPAAHTRPFSGRIALPMDVLLTEASLPDGHIRFVSPLSGCISPKRV